MKALEDRILRDGRVEGYAYAGAFHERSAYRWCCELSIYLDPDARRHGLGRRLYEALEAALKDMGILNLYACIAWPARKDEYRTTDSAAFHRRLGFVMVGRFHRCCYKFGRWYDMIFMEKVLGEHVDGAAPRLALPENP